MNRKRIRFDMGYGAVGNSATKFLMDHILDPEQEKRYRDKLEKEDKDKYDEYLQYEEAVNKHKKDRT